ncbi:MAG: DUF59 domain-containing protein [Betaproteobacteria bacterium]|nr:MAG: DUF59 domain-containing protein [Betaproteobacteria bacterium]
MPRSDETLARDALRRVLDPEVGINIVDLGLVYAIDVEQGHVRVRMTLTSAGCPMGGSLIEEVEAALTAVLPADTTHEVELVWDPPWSAERMSEAAKRQLGWTA